jgi:hypothetical protein
MVTISIGERRGTYINQTPTPHAQQACGERVDRDDAERGFSLPPSFGTFVLTIVRESNT